MSLLALQRDFRNWLVDAPSGMAQRLDAGPGLAVYHNAYRVQLSDCLRETFERLFLWLGEEQFLAAARRHIESHPPSSWTLNDYGETFPATLARMCPDDAEITELAALDWALSRAFDGEDAPSITAASLESVDWGKAVIRFVPTVRLVPVRTNAAAIWSALSAGTAPPTAAGLARPAALLVWRQDGTPCFRTIEGDEQEALAMALAGAPFDAICTRLVDVLGAEDGVAKAGALLGQWLQDGLVRNIAD